MVIEDNTTDSLTHCCWILCQLL